MNHFSAKNKIVVLLIVWFGLSAISFGYFFKILDRANKLTLLSVDKQKKELAQLKAEQQSESQAQWDLDTLAKENIQPEDFFSRDITLVNELKVLEALGQRLGVKMQIGGVSGTIHTVSKAKTITPLGVIPYSINVNGSLPRVVDFIETLENLRFITNVSNISISSADQSTVNVNMTANFYLKKDK